MQGNKDHLKEYIYISYRHCDHRHFCGMRNRNISLTIAQGAVSNITAKEFFTNNNATGVADATVFLDHVEIMTPNQKLKYAYFWELLKNNCNLLGMLIKRTDKNDLEYVWAEMELPRGKAPFKIILLSNAMFDFLGKYQRAEISIRFTLQELVNEAERIESNQPAIQD